MYFRTLVALVRKNQLLSSLSSSSASVPSSSTPWKVESISAFLASSPRFQSISLDFIITILLDHDFEQLAFHVARSRNKLDAFLRRFVSMEAGNGAEKNDGNGGGSGDDVGGTKDDSSWLSSLRGDSKIDSFSTTESHNVSQSFVQNYRRDSNADSFPWRLLLFEADLAPTECWILVDFVKAVNGLLEGFLLDADDDQLEALFKILSSSYALFINSLDLILPIVTRLKKPHLG